MSYGLIEISEVGEAEYPLIAVLHDAIDPKRRLDLSADPAPALTLLAHLEGNPLGYLVARQVGRALSIIACGVLPDYRRQGIATRMLRQARAVAGQLKLEQVEMRVPKSSPDTMAFLASCGFDRVNPGTDDVTFTRET